MSAVESRLAELGLTLPGVAAPVAAYIPALRTGRYVYTSGQVPLVEGTLPVTGKVGAEVTAEEAKELARICALNALAAVKSVVGDLDRVARVVKVVGFVASAPDFTGQPGVVNGASELLGQALGEKGVHARSAVGVAVLPLDAPVEVEIQVEIEDDAADGAGA
ncbi:RidA family protein [Streptomyces zingiberis]|uniref:RidA family protein n=1 Tax=Streptomyces zingiberis TaxID=2053010 RepID=A0ABX1BRM1_9ACTN|nr:RidA family protein [Streptomyces zingiberis]NJP99080.1 RidA family protein [Streptomyces zingiberis]